MSPARFRCATQLLLVTCFWKNDFVSYISSTASRISEDGADFNDIELLQACGFLAFVETCSILEEEQGRGNDT